MLRQLLARLSGGSARARGAEQELVDLGVVGTLLRAPSAHDLDCADPGLLRIEVQDALETQTLALFTALQSAKGADASVASSSAETSFARRPVDDAVNEKFNLVKRAVIERTGFFPTVEESCIDGAGQGVIMNGAVDAGRLVAFYPGLAYLPFQVKHIEDELYRRRGSAREAAAEKEYFDLYGSTEQRNEYAIQRFDGVILNAREGSVSSQPNFFAVANMINHPPKGFMPNVMVCPFDFKLNFVNARDMAVDRKSYVPNKIYESSGSSPRWWMMFREKEVFAPSLVMVSLRPIQDREELLVDYRFNPTLKLPEWYHPVDEIESFNRWGVEIPQGMHSSTNDRKS